MIVKGKITTGDLSSPFAKAVVDIVRNVIAMGCELHIDCAEELVAEGSSMGDCWGCNIYPDGSVEFTSLINIRPVRNNPSMTVADSNLQEKIRSVINAFLSL